MLQHLGHRMQPYLPAMLAITLVMLRGATTSVAALSSLPMEVDTASAQLKDMNDAEDDDNDVEQEQQVDERDREVRVSALRLLAQVWERFPSACGLYGAAWGPFLEAVEPLIPRLAAEAAAEK